ncbi:glycosyltransferase [Thiofilum flexile]|uniref:glycosyltransferase family protein n=1 Tax=Thiofilum flexile TaxID=125627 RepID=UPI00035DDB24|nr:glycosyltransferase [Thiofilum flexile]
MGVNVENLNDYPDLEEIKKIKNLKLALFNMYHIVKRPFLFFKVKKYLQSINCPVIVWNRDGSSNMGMKVWRQFILKHAPLFDLYASHTLQDLGALREKVLYLPNAAVIDDYYPSPALKQHYQYDVAFIGNMNANKYPEVKKRVSFLNQLAINLKALNINYYFVGQEASLEQQRHIIQQSRINLQYHAGCDTRFRDKTRFERSWGLPERCYGIPACGGFLLSDERKHGSDDFGEDWCFFEDSQEDCINKIQYYLNNFDLTRAIAERQQQRVLEQHTYQHRALQLLHYAEEWQRQSTKSQQIQLTPI